MKRSIEFKHWRTGEKIDYALRSSHPAEQIAKNSIQCPFDKTPLIFAYDDLSKRHYCPNCNTDYSGIEFPQQKEVDRIARKVVTEKQSRISALDEERKGLETFLAFAQTQPKCTQNPEEALTTRRDPHKRGDERPHPYRKIEYSP